MVAARAQVKMMGMSMDGSKEVNLGGMTARRIESVVMMVEMMDVRTVGMLGKRRSMEKTRVHLKELNSARMTAEN